MPQKLYNESLYNKLISLEDVYIGMLMEKLGSKIISLKKYYCKTKSSCYYYLNRKIEKVFVYFLHGLTPKRMIAGWGKITEKMMEVFSGKIRPKHQFL